MFALPLITVLFGQLHVLSTFVPVLPPDPTIRSPTRADHDPALELEALNDVGLCHPPQGTACPHATPETNAPINNNTVRFITKFYSFISV